MVDDLMWRLKSAVRELLGPVASARLSAFLRQQQGAVGRLEFQSKRRLSQAMGGQIVEVYNAVHVDPIKQSNRIASMALLGAGICKG